MNDNFTINSIMIKNPTTFKIERYNVTNMERLANADMAGDLIAQKHKFYFTYAAISAIELDVILSAIWHTETLFFDLTYNYNGTKEKCEVYVGSIPSELHRAGRDDNWVWKNVQFNLIEK